MMMHGLTNFKKRVKLVLLLIIIIIIIMAIFEVIKNLF
jgi:hypothetical protein